jgi:hypothetical protein
VVEPRDDRLIDLLVAGGRGLLGFLSGSGLKGARFAKAPLFSPTAIAAGISVSSIISSSPLSSSSTMVLISPRIAMGVSVGGARRDIS